MSMSNGVISLTDVTTDDVKRAISHSSTNVGVLCYSPNINVWSQYKPVQGGINAWGRTGFLSDTTVGQDATKIYTRVTGGESNPYCLGHYRGYNHNTQAPLCMVYGAGDYYIQPNGSRNIMLKYRASGLDFRPEGANALVIQQEMHGGGKKVIGGLRLSEMTLGSENNIEAALTGEGMAIGGKYPRWIYFSFGTTTAASGTAMNSSNTTPMFMVGYEQTQYKVLINIYCTQDGNQPPPPQQWGRIVLKLTNAPASIMNAVENSAVTFSSEQGRETYLKQIDFGYSEDRPPSQSDRDTFQRGVIRLYKDGAMKGLSMSYNKFNSPANGASFARIQNNQLVEFQIERPPANTVYNYEARWAYS